MVKVEVKTPNKRKSFANDPPSKKVKVENDNKPFTPAKKPKAENGSSNKKPFTPKQQNQSPKNKQLGTGPKFQNKQKQAKSSPDSEEKKSVKPFAGTKQLNKGQAPKKQTPPKSGTSDNKAERPKRKRKSQFGNLIAEVKSKEASRDAETLKKLDEKIEAITSRGELSKTAKRKLGILKKLKTICEEGLVALAAHNAQAKAERLAAAGKNATKIAKKPAGPQVVKLKKKQVQAVPIKKEEDDDDDEEDSDEEESDEQEKVEAEDSDEEAEDDEDSDEVEGEEDEDDDDDDEEEDDSDEEEEDDSHEEEAPAPKEKPAVSKATKPSDVEGQRPDKKQPSLSDLKNTEIVKKGQKRFVLFVGNIPYDTTKEDLIAHFAKIGEIADIRIPTEKGSNKPRGFAYVEVKDETAYEKCMSMHNSQIKGRRINVQYTQGGKKKGEDKKKEIKAKNMKLHALRKQGKLAGSVKETQKRSFRRNKNQNRQANVESTRT